MPMTLAQATAAESRQEAASTRKMLERVTRNPLSVGKLAADSTAKPSLGGRLGWERGSSLGANLWVASFIGLLGVFLLLVPCQARAEDHDFLLEAYVEVWNTGDVDRLEELVAPDFRRHAGKDDSVDSLAALAEFITQTRSIYDHLKISVDDSVSTGERGAFRGGFYGVHKAVNGVVEFPVMSMMRFADGLIAEEWIVGDNFLSLMSLGYELVPPGFETIPPEAGSGAASGDTRAPKNSRGLLGAVLLAPLATVPAVASSGHEAQLRAYIEVWNSGNTEALQDILTEDFARHGNYGTARSREELGALIRNFRGFFRDLQIELLDSFAGIEKGAMRFRFSGGYGETSFEMTARNFGMVRFADGKIAEEWVAGNTTDFWTSMGYRIMPPGTKMVPPPVLDPPGSHVPPPPDFSIEELKAFAAETQNRAPKRAGRLEIASEVNCRLTLDGRSIGDLEAGTKVVLNIERGEHSVKAASRGGSIFFTQGVKVKSARTVRVDIVAPARVIVHPRNRTTEDLETGLMWQMVDNGSDIKKGAAENYCRESSSGSYSDWRLPSIYELESLYAPTTESSKRFQTIDGITLSGCCPWTISPHGDFYWTFIFYNGLRYIKHESIGKFSRALCVRYAG